MSRDDRYLSPVGIGLLNYAAQQHGFVVDYRGIYPTMIKGQNAKQYTCDQDLLDFVASIPKS